MDLKALLEKIDQFAGSAVGQKPGDQVRGTEIAKPIKSGDDHPFKGRLVGASESVLKDLSKGPTPKTKEQELAEEFQSFLEAEFKDTVDKRPSRKGSRPSRGHEPKSGYKTIKADEGVPYKATNPHPALQDPVVKKVLQQMRPGLTGLEMNNEAFLYFAYELGKTRAREMWEDYGPAIKYGYQSGIGVNEGWESGPEEYKEPYDDADDAYERQRQEKIDTEAEKEWAKLPKVSTYKLLGRGPNMEPNYEFGGKEYDTLEAAIEARKELMADPKTPHPEHIGIQTLTRVVNKEKTNEAVYTAPKNREEYDAKMSALQDLQMDPNTANDPELQKKIIIYMDNLQKVAHQHGWLSQPVESRGHKIIATKLKDIERSKKFASGELKIPTPQERQAQLKKLETEPKQVKEYGATNNPVQKPVYAQSAGTTGLPDVSKLNPQQKKELASQVGPDAEKNAAAAVTALKSATGSTASPDKLIKALDSADQGKSVDAQTMTALQPVMDVVKKAGTNPKLSGTLKSLINQAKTI